MDHADHNPWVGRSSPIFGVNGGFTPSCHLRPYTGREQAVFILIKSGDDGDGKEERKRKVGSPWSPCKTWQRWLGIQLTYSIPQVYATQGHI